MQSDGDRADPGPPEAESAAGEISLQSVLNDELLGPRRSLDQSISVTLDLSSDPLVVRADAGRLVEMISDLCQLTVEITSPNAALCFRLRPLEIENHPHLADGGYARLVLFAQPPTGSDEMLVRLLDGLFGGPSLSTRRSAIQRLMLSRATATAHGGMLASSFEPGVGIRWTLDLPLTPPRGPSARASGPANLATGPAILIVDDESAVREAASGLLRHLGYSVLEARNGAECVEVYRNHVGQVSLVILDMAMPGISYQSVIEQLHLLNPQVRILISSGLIGASPSVPPGSDSKIRGFLPKPFRLRDLDGRIREVLSGA